MSAGSQAPSPLGYFELGQEEQRIAQRSARLWSDESAQALVEYAILIAIVAIGLIAASVVFRDGISEIVVAISEAVKDIPNGCKNPVPGEQNPNCS